MSNAWLDWLLNAALFLVIFGVVLEGAEYVEKVRQNGWELDNRWRLAEKLGFTLLVIGLAGEWYFSAKIHDQDAKIISETAPRHLSRGGRDAIGAACANMVGHPFNVSVVQEAEVMHFAEDVETGLTGAGIVPSQSFSIGADFPTDVAISGPQTEDGLVDCLTKALRNQGVTVTRSWGPETTLMVGIKPRTD